MKTITYEEFLKLEPCWLEDGRAEKLAKIGARKKEWTAVDILKLRGVGAEDKLWAVLEAELIPDPIAHEFARRCAERALGTAEDDGNNASWNAIHAKQRWLRDEATDEELAVAEAAWAAAKAVERKWQVGELLRMLEKGVPDGR